MPLLEVRPIDATTKEPHNFTVHATNGKEIGSIYREVDGYFVFWPASGDGFWAAALLHEIANKLDEMNKSWHECVMSMPPLGD